MQRTHHKLEEEPAEAEDAEDVVEAAGIKAGELPTRTGRPLFQHSRETRSE